jgi:hypothetical protein
VFSSQDFQNSGNGRLLAASRFGQPLVTFRQLRLSRSLVRVGQRLMGRPIIRGFAQGQVQPANAFLLLAVAQEKDAYFTARGRIMRLPQHFFGQLAEAFEVGVGST